MKKFVLIALLSIFVLSCSSYQQLLKNGTDEQKFVAAKNYFLEKKYTKASTLLGDLVSANAFSGKKMEEVMYLWAESFAGLEDYYTASLQYADYVKAFPKGTYAEECKFKTGYCSYLESPDVRLDQEATYNAIAILNEYVNLYPNGSNVDEAYKYIDELKDKLAYKGYLEAKLYYNLGLYMGNNYRSAVVVANNTLKQYPITKHREALLFLILKSKYDEAIHSVEQKRKERFSEVIDEYYKYNSEFQDTKNSKEAEKIFNQAKKHTEN